MISNDYEANRRRAIAALRTTTKTQGFGQLVKRRYDADGAEDCYCALGVIATEVLGGRLAQDAEGVEFDHNGLTQYRDADVPLIVWLAAFGYQGPHPHPHNVLTWNDSGQTFNEIADKLEAAWFPQTEESTQP